MGWKGAIYGTIKAGWDRGGRRKKGVERLRADK